MDRNSITDEVQEEEKRYTYCEQVGSKLRFFCHCEGFINPLSGFGTAEEALRTLLEWERERSRWGLRGSPLK
jgi:hypothetical protein